MIFKTIQTASQMRDEFRLYGRADQFSYHAYDALFDYLWELGEAIEGSFQFDVVSLCCEWTEYDSIEKLAEAYDMRPSDYACTEYLEERLCNRGTLLKVEGGSVLFSG